MISGQVRVRVCLMTCKTAVLSQLIELEVTQTTLILIMHSFSKSKQKILNLCHDFIPLTLCFKAQSVNDDVWVSFVIDVLYK